MNVTFIGIDLGGTKVLLQGFNKKLEIGFELKEKTKSGSQKELLDQIAALIDHTMSSQVKGIGIAVPGIVNQKEGKVVHTPHLPFKKNFHLKKYLEEKYQVPVAVDNDINAFLTAERERKELKNCQNIVAVMVGTGVGGAIFCNGKLLYGKDGFAGEIGHMIISKNEILDTLEKRTSGFFIPKIAREMGMKPKITAYDLDKKTPENQRLKEVLLKDLGLGLSNLNLIFNPEYIVLGGSIYHFLLSSGKKQLKKIIADHALDKKSPTIIDAKKTTSVPEGIVRLLLKSNFPLILSRQKFLKE